MELDFSVIKEYYKDIDKNELDTIINNCTINKTFYKFIILCIKLNINIFKKINEKWVLKSTRQLLTICEKHKKNLIKGYGFNILKYTLNDQNDKLIIEKIEDDLVKLKKNIKNLDTLIYILKNIYNDKESLKNMCYYSINYHDGNKTKAKYIPIENINTYIAEYSN